MKQINTLLLVVGCMSASFATGCKSSSSASNAVNNNQDNGAQPTKPSTPSNPGTTGKSVCFLNGCVPTVAKTKIADPRGDYKYPDHKRFPSASQREYYRAPIAFIDLSKLNSSMRLSKDFNLIHFASAAKGRYALLSPVLIRKVQNIKDRLGSSLRVTSGYRSPGYNRGIKGSATFSRHMYGDAVDLGGKPMKQIREACVANNASFFLLYKDGHVHCDWRAVPLDPALFPPTKAASAHDQLMQNAITMSMQTNINFAETSEGVRMSVALPEMELEGEPHMEWIVTSPSGQQTTFDSLEPVLQSIEGAGTYHVKVIVGGFIESQAEIDLE